MKICWDNLEDLKYLPSSGRWYKGHNTYEYVDACEICGEPFLALSYSGNKQFCSNKCAGKSKRGSNNVFTRPEVRKKLKQVDRSYMTGENNLNWKGGKYTTEERYQIRIELTEWRKEIFERDDYTCQLCGKRGNGYLNAHHIKPFSDYPELRLDLDNGITLCADCHNLTKGGKEKLYEEQFKSCIARKHKTQL